MNKTLVTMVSGLALLGLSLPASAKDHPAGPAANVGTIDCATMPTMPISYFRAGSTLNPGSASSGAGAGAGRVSFTSVLEIHAPLASASGWRNALDTGSHLASCTVNINGRSGTRSLTFSNLLVTSVVVFGKHVDGSPLPRYYTDVMFAIAPAPSGTPPSWDLQTGKSY